MGLQLDYLVKGMSKVLKYIDEKKSNSQMVSYKQDETDESYDYAFPVKSIDELKKIEILLRNNKKQYDAAVSADKSQILLFSIVYSYLISVLILPILGEGTTYLYGQR